VVIKGDVEPILNTLVTTVQELGSGLAGGLLANVTLGELDLAEDLGPKVTDVFQTVADVLNTAEVIVQDVLIVGDVLGPVL
jgi:hypothetical protein